MRTVLSLCSGLLALVAFTQARADIDVRVGSGAGCNVATIQAAINSASPVNGITNIKISRNLTYTGQQLNITSRNVRLIGGYANCTQIDPDTTRTVVSGAGGSANTVITVLGTSGAVGFYNLEIIAGDEVTNNTGKGGGVAIGGGPHALIYFENTWIHDNQAGYGGGIWVENENSSNANDVFVRIGDNTRIYANYGAYGGGGIWCRNAKVNMTGSVNATIGTAIYQNTTAGTVNSTVINGSGGGIRAENCVMNIATRSNISLLGTISQNIAGGNGGGISVSGERAKINLYTQDAGRPTSIVQNEAGGVGGGIDIGSSATVNAYDVIVGSNTARVGGGGISMFDNDDDPAATVVMTHSLVGAPNVAGSPEGVAVNCNATQHCNRISGNAAIATNGTRQPGAAARVSADNTIATNGSRAELTLSGTEISSNEGESLVRLYLGGDNSFSEAQLDGTLVIGNIVTGTLLHNPDDEFRFVGYLGIINATIAGNTIGGTDVIRTADNYRLRNSIVWQPGKRVLNVLNASASAAKIDYLLASDLLGIPASTHNLVADPQFVNAVTGDYRLRLGSPAIDYAPLFTDLSSVTYRGTADNLERVVDLGSVSNEFGAQDLGAYERQFACAEDTIFCNGFE